MSHAANKAAAKQKVLDALTRPLTYGEIADRTGITRKTVNIYLGEMKDDGIVFVAGTVKHHGSDTRVWAAVNGATVSFDPEQDDFDLEAQIFRRRKPTVVHVHRDPMVAALFGEAA